MKRFFKNTLWAVLLCSVLFIGWRTFVWVGSHESAVVFDGQSEYISGFYLHGLHWTGLRSIWNRPTVLRGKDYGSFSFDCISPLPGATAQVDSAFTVKISIDVEYRLKKGFICEYEDLAGDYVRKCIVRNSNTLLRDELNVQLKTAGAEGYVSAVNSSVSAALILLKKRMNDNGVDLTRFDVRSVFYPDAALYRVLLDHRYISIKQLLAQDLNIRSAEADIAGIKMRDEYYDRRLEKISQLIEKNPLLLKFIYIDKLGGNVKMIQPSGTDGLPAITDTERVKGGISAGRQIDNLK